MTTSRPYIAGEVGPELSQQRGVIRRVFDSLRTSAVGNGPTRIATAEGALTAAIDAWVSEWMPEEPDEDRAVAIWVGAHASSHVNARCHVLGELVERI